MAIVVHVLMRHKSNMAGYHLFLSAHIIKHHIWILLIKCIKTVVVLALARLPLDIHLAPLEFTFQRNTVAVILPQNMRKCSFFSFSQFSCHFAACTRSLSIRLRTMFFYRVWRDRPHPHYHHRLAWLAFVDSCLLPLDCGTLAVRRQCYPLHHCADLIANSDQKKSAGIPSPSLGFYNCFHFSTSIEKVLHRRGI